MMTMHTSKGLEWPVVAVISGDVGAPVELTGKGLEEAEARLIYVAASWPTQG